MDDNQSTQTDLPPVVDNQPQQGQWLFFLTQPRLILVAAALALLLIFGLGVSVGQKRTFTPPPTPTAIPITSTPLPTEINEQGTVDQSCFEGYDCVIGIEQGSQTIYSRGICQDGVCIPRPTSVPKNETKESR